MTTTLSEVLDLSREITGSATVPYPVSNAVLAAHGVASWMGPKSLPLWIDNPSFRYMATMDTTAAREHGLTLRPLRDTLAAALRYEEHRHEPRLAGLSDEEEVLLRRSVQGPRRRPHEQDDGQALEGGNDLIADAVAAKVRAWRLGSDAGYSQRS